MAVRPSSKGPRVPVRGFAAQVQAGNNLPIVGQICFNRKRFLGSRPSRRAVRDPSVQERSPYRKDRRLEHNASRARFPARATREEP